MKDFFKYVLASITGYVIIMAFFSIVGLVVLIGLAASSNSPQTIKSGSVLKLNWSGEIVDRKKPDPLEGLPFFDDDRFSVQGLKTILESIEKAKTDPNIEGIYMQFGAFSAGLSTCGEIRDALIDFSKSGKFIYSYAGLYSQKAYLIASVSDSIFMNPGGGLDLRGLVSEQMYFKNTLEKLDVEVNVIKHGRYKSAVEPYTHTESSKENKEQMDVLLSGLWDYYAEKIGESRGISREDLDRYANKVMLFQNKQLNLDYHLVDALAYVDQVESALNKKLGNEEGEKINFVDLIKYKNSKSGKVKEDNDTDDKIAVVYAEGGIDMGRDGIQSGKLSKTLRKILNDENIKAVVLRVNSPGGSAYGSEQVWREAVRISEKMPLVVSMGDMAASGGYYIACAADTILASPSTITGSIGAFGVLMKFGKTFNKFGVTFDRVKTHQYADIVSGTKSMLPAEKALLQTWMDETYHEFVTRCAEGRGETYEQIDKVAEGRVWTGTDAKDVGLVDVMGGLRDAVKLAAEMAHLDQYNVEALPKEKSFMETLMEDLESNIETRIMKIKLGDEYEVYQKMKSIENVQGVQMRIPFDLEIY